MNRGMLIDLMQLKFVDIELPWYRVDSAFQAVLDAVRSRLEAGQGVYWPGVGLFGVIECAARQRYARKKKADGQGYSLRMFPPYRKLTYRRSVLFDKIR